MKRIQLTKGMVALVDDEDFSRVSMHRWYANNPRGELWYALGRVEGKLVYLHRYILGFPDTSVDHRNRDGLDNRKCNLRLASSGQNRVNSKNSKTAARTSRFKGVCRLSGDRCLNKWVAQITVKGKVRYLGRFATEKEAAAAYNVAAVEAWGEFARTNLV